jgi:hypothetical protein
MMGWPTKIHVDTIEFYAECDAPFLPDQDMYARFGKDGVFKFLQQNRQIIPGKYRHNATVKPDLLKKRLRYSGSPFACANGQNVYTSGSVPDACWEALYAIRDRLGLAGLPRKIRRMLPRLILCRVDLAANFQFRDAAEVCAFINQAKLQLSVQKIPTGMYPTGFHFNPSKGEEYSIRVYAKGNELASHGATTLSVEELTLIEECDGILRLEIQLRGRALRRFGLVDPTAWTPEKTREVFTHYLALLPLSNVKVGPMSPEELAKVPAKLRPVLNNWASGVALEMVYPCAGTRKRYRRELRKYGYDINIPFTDQGYLYSLKDRIRGQHAIKGYPDWLNAAGFYPEN